MFSCDAQTTPGESWDYIATQNMIRQNLNWNHPTPWNTVVLTTASGLVFKGRFVAYDAENGIKLWENQVQASSYTASRLRR
jgi:outer membrane protein assembly factor BamB